MERSKKAYPVTTSEGIIDDGADLLDWFAVKAPQPSKSRVEREMMRDKRLNPHNESHKPTVRDEIEIECQLRYEWAETMMRVRRNRGHN